jgi:hypothetical protein
VGSSDLSAHVLLIHTTTSCNTPPASCWATVLTELQVLQHFRRPFYILSSHNAIPCALPVERPLFYKVFWHQKS